MFWNTFQPLVIRTFLLPRQLRLPVLAPDHRYENDERVGKNNLASQLLFVERSAGVASVPRAPDAHLTSATLMCTTRRFPQRGGSTNQEPREGSY